MTPEPPTPAEAAPSETGYIEGLETDSYEYRVAMTMLEQLAEEDGTPIPVVHLAAESKRRHGLGAGSTMSILRELTAEGYIEPGHFTGADLLTDDWREGKKNQTTRVLTDKGEDFFTAPR